MEELSGWHLTSNAMAEIRSSSLSKEILRICKSNAENTISFHSSSVSCLISSMRLRGRSLVFAGEIISVCGGAH